MKGSKLAREKERAFEAMIPLSKIQEEIKNQRKLHIKKKSTEE